MNGRGLSWFGVGLMLPLLAGGAPLVRDPGDGLACVRVRELPADLPVPPPGPPPCVVDVRYVAAGPEVAVAFAAGLKFRATPRSPIFVLANRETSADLRRVLRAPLPNHGSAAAQTPRLDIAMLEGRDTRCARNPRARSRWIGAEPKSIQSDIDFTLPTFH